MGVSMMQSKRRILLNEPHLITPTPTLLHSFNTNMVAPLKECKVHFEPVQEGSGDPSPNNVRAISGWTGVKIYHAGKNIFPADDTDYHDIYLRKGTNLFASVNKEGISGLSNPAVRYYDKNKDRIDYWTLNVNSTTGRRGRSFSLLDDAYWFRIVEIKEGALERQLEFGTSGTEYEAYKGHTYPISWQSEAGTVYGGYVDLLNGELVATHAVRQIVGNENWIMSGGITGYCAYRPTLLNVSPAISSNRYRKPMSDKLKGIGEWATMINEAVINPRGHFYFGVTEELSTKEKVNEWIQSIGGFELVYPINPIRFQINPVTLRALKGRNNFWSDANGNIELSYWKH